MHTLSGDDVNRADAGRWRGRAKNGVSPVSMLFYDEGRNECIFNLRERRREPVTVLDVPGTVSLRSSLGYDLKPIRRTSIQNSLGV